jgi:peptidoglycan/xylan/chitin deacetylase (PgdA/CDA1 family)
MALELEQIQPWDGQSGTGAEVRGALNRNFEKLKDISLLAGTPIKDSFTSVDLLPRPGIPGNNYLVNGHVFSWSTEIDDYIDQGPIKGENGENGNPPYIGINNNWWIDGVDTGKTALGKDGQTPYVGNNGNWWLGNYDTGLKSFNDFLKGYMPEATTTYLNSKYPNPLAGWIAYVPNAASPTGYYIADVNAGAWRITTSPAPAVSASIEEANNRLASGFLADKFTTGDNVIAELTETPVSNNSIWTSGFLLGNGSILKSTTWVHSRKFYPFSAGLYMINAKLWGNARHVIYDASLKVIASISETDNGGVNLSYQAPENARWIKISRERIETSQLSIVAQNSMYGINFPRISLVNDLGLNLVAGTNIIGELSSSDINDKNLWSDGFVYDNNKIIASNTFKYSRKYYYVPAGYYNMIFNIYGNARVVFVDEAGNVKKTISNADGQVYSSIEYMSEHTFVRLSSAISGDTSGIKIYALDSVVSKSLVQNFAGLSRQPISGFGAYDIFLKSKQLEVPIKKRVPVVTFICDDGRREDEWLVNLFNSKKVKGTFAIIINSMKNSPSMMSTDEVVALYKDGHDIASHTLGHVHLAEIPIEDAEAEIYGSRLALNELGIECPTFIAPYGSYNAQVLGKIASCFKTNFKTDEFAAANTPPINDLLLTRRSFDNMGGGTGSTLQKCKDYVDGALVSGEWLIFAVHSHYAEYSLPAGQSRRDELGALIDYIKSLSIPILSAKQAYDFYKNSVQLRETTTTGIANVYQVGMDGTT